ncbi:Conserved oligomeric Golgi complex subunit 5-like Protein [Tribolium castaneum]|uniref:Conserved oligomeric Golgi complex subunit 5 n=2 Tax=Tribolium castaneum TaxID=7070 RepID=D6WNB2_TRICA|nr:Conserved oligomeric Golgi complex subunit 5-like Protein [Tribolium castaneum]
MDNSSSETDVIEQIENDEFYSCFLKTGSKNAIPQALSISEQVKKLGEGIELISRELQKQVLEKHDDLLRQGNHATKLENVLNTMNGHVQNLFANAERLRNQVTGPYNALEMHTKVLGRLHLASHILRQVNRIQQLSKRLANTNDPVQKATILHELEQLASDPDLKDIDAVTSELRNIRAQQQKVVKLATGSLNQGIINENVAQTTTALQIFINLGTIDATLHTTIENNFSECRECLKTAFDASIVSSGLKTTKGPGRATLTTSQGFRNKIWSEIEKAFSEEIYQNCKQIKFLQTTVNNLNIQNIDSDIATKFWTKLGNLLKSEIKNTSSAVQQMLEEDYPKLLKCFYEMCEKLKYDQFVFDRQVLEKCENSYLSSSLNRLLDPAQSMFSSEGEVPSHDQIDSLIRVISTELSVALIEETLSEKICKNVSKSIKMFALKTEQQIETGPEAAQVIGGNANSGQQRNIQFANALYYFQVQIQRMLSNMKDSLPQSGITIINESLQVLVNLVGAIIQPIVVSINSTIETIIITIHLETDWAKLQVPINKNSVVCSPYMRELSQFVTRVYHTYLSSFNNKEVLLEKCSEIAVRCIELLVRHSSLLRPISQGGRVRLQSDYLHLEGALRVICPHLSDLGRPYRLLKSMASLVTLTPEEIVASQASESSVPHSTVLLLLFSFAGSELASPHQNTAWSLPKLSAWLDEHPSESDRLDLIVGALQKYENLVRQKNSVNYDPVYPIMSTFLENAVKTVK